MVRKLMITVTALMGFTLAIGGNAWADRDRGDRGHRDDKVYHHNDKTPPGYHYGWDKGKGNPHRDRYEHRREYPHRDRDHRWGSEGDHRWNRDRHHRWDRDRHSRDRYRDHRRHDRHDGRFRLGVSVIDDLFGVAVAVSGSR